MSDEDPQVGDRVRMTPQASHTYEGEVATVGDDLIGLKVYGSDGWLAVPRSGYEIKILKRAVQGPAADLVGTWRLDPMGMDKDLYHKIDGDTWLNASTGESYPDRYVRFFPICTIDVKTKESNGQPWTVMKDAPEPPHTWKFRCAHPSGEHYIHWHVGHWQWVHVPGAEGFSWDDLLVEFFPLTRVWEEEK